MSIAATAGAMAARFTFGYAGFALDGVDAAGCRWTTTESPGWFGSAPVRSSGEVRAGQDGEEPATPLRAARLVTLRGTVRTDAGIGVLERSVRRFAALPETGVLSGTSEAFTLAGNGQLEDAPDAAILSPALGTWQVTVKLPDPLLYEAPVFLQTGLSGVAGTGRVWPRVWPRDWGVPAGQTPGSLDVPNDGTAPYWPVLRVDGPVDTPVITLNDTGDWVRYNGTLRAGQWLDIDCANRRVLLNGQTSVSTNVDAAGRFLIIPVGGGSLSWNANSADMAARLSVYASEGAWK